MAAGIAEIIATTKPGAKTSELWTSAGAVGAIAYMVETLLKMGAPEMVIIVSVLCMTAIAMTFIVGRIIEKNVSKVMASPKRFSAAVEVPPDKGIAN